MRARYPDVQGHVRRAGVDLGFELYENDGPTILLMPTWTLVHSRFWKMQVPYLSRHYRVVTYDGPGNGRSGRVTDPARYSPDEYALDAVAVLDATETERATVAGLSLGAAYSVRLGRLAPDRVEGIVMIGPSIPLTPPSPERAKIVETINEQYPDDVTGWGKYNIAYWHDHYEDFTQFFFSQCLTEPHSTKGIEDGVGWASETSAHVLAAEAAAPQPDENWPVAIESLQCPLLVIHGTHDQISPHERGVEAARLARGDLISMKGSGHLPLLRDPVKVNLAIKEFIDNSVGVKR